MEKQDQGTCPKCGSVELEYTEYKECSTEFVGYPYKCSACEFEGTECYKISFDYHSDRQGNLLEPTLKVCSYTGCNEKAVIALQQTVGKRQVINICEGHKQHFKWLKDEKLESKFYKVVSLK